MLFTCSDRPTRTSRLTHVTRVQLVHDERHRTLLPNGPALGRPPSPRKRRLAGCHGNGRSRFQIELAARGASTCTLKIGPLRSACCRSRLPTEPATRSRTKRSRYILSPFRFPIFPLSLFCLPSICLHRVGVLRNIGNALSWMQGTLWRLDGEDEEFRIVAISRVG